MWVITDAKMDDCLALIILYKWMIENFPNKLHCSSKYKQTTLDVVVTNINHIKGAVALIDLLFQDVVDSLAKREEGGVDILPPTPKIRFFQGKHEEEAKSHEAGLYDEALPKKPRSTRQPTILQLKNDAIQNASDDCVFLLAPCDDNLLPLLTKAACVFMGIGYNSSTLLFEQISTFKNLVMINNYGSYIDSEEGGRFDADDEELWDSVYQISPRFRALKPHALNDTRLFVARQLHKFGNQTGVDVNYNEVCKNLLAPNVLDKAKLIQKCVGPGTYLDRIVEQLGKGLQIECTDGQHMALWLYCLSETEFAHISFGNKKHLCFKVSSTETNYRAYFELTKSEVRKQFIKSFRIQ
mmetsp:Transcript_11268/g.12900  ORF Transcript_11268/g.12900 Transcript_11268/m.12900 type:complete len:354 (+) Transcript_11268:138-1199(+)